jgi:hypothetical protein
MGGPLDMEEVWEGLRVGRHLARPTGHVVLARKEYTYALRGLEGGGECLLAHEPRRCCETSGLGNIVRDGPTRVSGQR